MYYSCSYITEETCPFYFVQSIIRDVLPRELLQQKTVMETTLIWCKTKVTNFKIEERRKVCCYHYHTVAKTYG